ncbi:MAG: PAS domain S-box protein, partial [Candidatus Sericytochromatia bacterium]
MPNTSDPHNRESQLREALEREQAAHVSARRRGETERLQFELLINSVTDYAIFMLDPDGRIMTWNRGAERIKGYRPADIIGKPYETFFLPEDVAAGKPHALLQLALQEGHIEDEGWRVRHDGTRFWANAVITALRDPQGNLVGFGKVTRDLTDRKRTEEQVQQLVTSLKEADQLKDQFLSILSHELRTPINAIMGFGSILGDELAGPLNPKQHHYVSKILSGADTLLGLVNDLLDMSRIQAGKFTLEPGDTSFQDVASEVLATLAPLAGLKHQQLVNEVAPGLPTFVADARRLGQVLTNLVNNAIKFTPEGGTVRVRAILEGATLRCEVEDTGIGIAEEDLPKLFQRFGQLDMSHTRAASGTGLGL